MPPLIPQDKANHIVYGALISIVSLASSLLIFRVPPARALVLAMCVTVVMGWLKEAYDTRHRDKHTPDPWDIVATSAGGVLAMASAFVVRWLQ